MSKRGRYRAQRVLHEMYRPYSQGDAFGGVPLGIYIGRTQRIQAFVFLTSRRCKNV